MPYTPRPFPSEYQASYDEAVADYERVSRAVAYRRHPRAVRAEARKWLEHARRALRFARFLATAHDPDLCARYPVQLGFVRTYITTAEETITNHPGRGTQ
ncbi:hypothetical protein ACFWPV_09995 [Streptomyces uncialis]|uniref:hypothetical protein n=1 Tax=Streptomyces uncialis TaxID=1048205 RepID=UPI003650BA1F